MFKKFWRIFMANMIDYMKWRGDIGFDKSPINEVDFLILSTLSYLRFSDIVHKNFKQDITLQKAAELFANAKDFEIRKSETENVDPNTVEVLEIAGKTTRFGQLKVNGFWDRLNIEKEEQFAAITFTSKEAKWTCITFRGTDNNLIGWKEDFNLAIMDEVPSQADAVEYFNEAASFNKGTLYVAGHSKGGNLAIYAAKNAKDKFKKRIKYVYDFDGPGFYQSFFTDESYKKIKDKIKTYVPGLSIVGALFWHDGPYTALQSSGRGIYEHDPLNWQIIANHFDELPDVTEDSKSLHRAVNEWIVHISPSAKKTFIDTVFKLLLDTNAKTLMSLQNNMWENLYKVLKGLKNLDKDTKELVNDVLKLFTKYMRINVEEKIKRDSKNFIENLNPENKKKSSAKNVKKNQKVK